MNRQARTQSVEQTEVSLQDNIDSSSNKVNSNNTNSGAPNLVFIASIFSEKVKIHTGHYHQMNSNELV